MMTLWNWLFDPSGLSPHGFCLTWEPGLIALHAGSDMLVGISYLSIPLAMASFAQQRPDLQYSWVVYAFIGFILACAVTHLLAVLTLWVPAYGIEGLVKAVTALLSMATAALLWPLIPRLVALPSPTQLVRVNAELSRSVADHERTAHSLRESEALGRVANVALEARVAARTAELQEANDQLKAALAERAAALQALARSEAEFRASFEGAAVGKMLADPVSGRILRVNQSFAAMLGVQPEDLVGKTSLDVTPSEDLERDAADDAPLRRGETDVYIREKRYIRADGTTFWARVSAKLAQVPTSDHPTLMVTAVEDIDARRRAEAELIDANHRLKSVVEERTVALDQRDLLLREVYHRVKNNLQIVDSLLAIQAQKLEHQEGKTAIRSLRGRIFALGLVHHQLMGSKDLKTFDIAAFLHDLSRNIVDGGDSRNVFVTVDACRLNVGLDFAIPLGLIVTELVTNSLKHAFPLGAGAISVILRRAEDETLVLIVSDNGAGMPMGAPLGAGLGHRLVGRLVTQIEGTMTVRNSGGTTTQISVAMPVMS